MREPVTELFVIYLELQAAFRSPNQIAHYVINKVVVETVSDEQNLINFAPF